MKNSVKGIVLWILGAAGLVCVVALAAWGGIALSVLLYQ